MTEENTVVKNGGEPLLDLQRMAAGIRWRRRTLAVMALVGLVAGIGVGAFLPLRASASARIFVVHVDETSSSDEGPMKTDLALLQTTTVAADAIDRLHLATTPDKFVSTYTGTIVASNILEVTGRGADGPDAIARTQAIADAFIAVHVGQADDAAKAQVDALARLRDAAQKELDGVNDEIKTVGADAVKQAALVERRASLSSQVSSLDQRAQEAGIGSPTVAAGTKIIDAAHVTSHSMLVSGAIYGGIGLLIGLGLGLVVAAVATVARDRPVLRRDISAHLGASVIAQLPAPLRGPRRLIGRSRAETERRQAAATLARLVRQDADAVSVLELGCPTVAAALARDIAAEIAGERPVVLVDDLPRGQLAALADPLPDGVTLVPGGDFPGSAGTQKGSRVIAVGNVGPGSPWTDVRRLGAETLVVIRAGSTEASWLHTVARQLADAGVVIIGVVVVHPDPRDRSDGTLWDALQTAVRGRLAARPAPATAGAVVQAVAMAALQAAQTAVPAPAPDRRTAAPVRRPASQPHHPAPATRPARPAPRVAPRGPITGGPTDAPRTEAISLGPVDDRTRAIPVSPKPGRGPDVDETVALPAQRQHRNGSNGPNGNGHKGSVANGQNGHDTNGHNTNGHNGSGHGNGHGPASPPQGQDDAQGRGRPVPRTPNRPAPADGHPTLKMQPVVPSTSVDRTEAT